jgi:hypothetical protein
MPFIIEQIQPPPSVGSNDPSDPMVAYLFLLFLVCYFFRGLIVGLIFMSLRLTLLAVFGFATYKLFL